MSAENPSLRQRVLAAIKARVEAITIDGGFNTDAGKVVFLGFAPAMGDDDPEFAVAILVGDDEVSLVQEHVFYWLPIDVQVLGKASVCASDEGWIVIEEILQDVKRAIELEDRTLNKLLETRLERGSTRTLERAPGSLAVGAVVTYRAPIAEQWGNP